GARYLPIEIDEFERLLSAAQTNLASDPQQKIGQITKADLHASLVGDDLLVGRVRLDINHTADGTRILAMEPLSLAVKSATWLDKKSPARLGAGVDGRMGLVVDHSAARQLEWSLRGERNAGV